MSKRISKTYKKGSWGHYLKKGLELGALGAVTGEGAEATTGSIGKPAMKGGSRIQKIFKDQANQYIGDQMTNLNKVKIMYIIK